jgi:uncharacterized protein with ATP-grasp and redox domains
VEVKRLKPGLVCASCLLTWLIERLALVGREDECYGMVRSVSKVICDEFQPTRNLGSLANRSIEIADEMIRDCAKHFEKIKSGNNQLARQALPKARDFIAGAKNAREAFERACALAVAGNVAPIGAPSGASRFEAVENILNGRSPLPSFQGDVYGAARNSSHILYVADNSGEIGFDSLLISILNEMGKKITLVVKDGPFFEDATQKEVSFFGLDDCVDRVLTTRGFFVPAESSPALVDAFKKSDLVICKGTGNYEGLQGETEGKSTIFMLKVKCRHISKMLQMNIGDFVVKLVE